ncbi:MAG: hypothetical protein ABI472_20645 [Ginsengibacter sp.]
MVAHSSVLAPLPVVIFDFATFDGRMPGEEAAGKKETSVPAEPGVITYMPYLKREGL